MSWSEFAPAGATKGQRQLGQGNKKENSVEWWERAGVKFKVNFDVNMANIVNAILFNISSQFSFLTTTGLFNFFLISL